MSRDKHPIRENDCRNVEERIDLYLAEGLQKDLQQRLDSHISECSQCKTLVSIFSGENTSGEGFQLTDLILKSTSGSSACEQAKFMLPDFVDQMMSNEEITLVENHLEICTDCRQLADTLFELDADLPGLAEVSVPDDLTDFILSATSQQPGYEIGYYSRFIEFWQKIISRPRFSFEAAYVGSLIVLSILTFLPTDLIQKRSEERLTGIQVEVAGIGQTLPQTAKKIWSASEDAFQGLGDATGNKAKQLALSFEKAGNAGKNFSKKTATKVLETADGIVSDVKSSGIKYWQTIFKKTPDTQKENTREIETSNSTGQA